MGIKRTADPKKALVCTIRYTPNSGLTRCILFSKVTFINLIG